jgi:hypothetical protein
MLAPPASPPYMYCIQEAFEGLVEVLALAGRPGPTEPR